MKRLTIYAFYDPAGLVDDYVVDCVAAMAEHSDRVLVVSNGMAEAGSASRLVADPSVDLVERENEGFDIWGYKHGLESVGWEALGRYDEVVLMNSTIAGPLYPLSEMFDAMDVQDLDFWGLTAHAGEDYDPWDLLPTGKIERHIQSYFTVIRNSMLRSPEFRAYWDSLPLIRSYTEAVAMHEAVFTREFEELGFRWTCYVDGTDLEDITSYPLMFLPEQVLIERRCPFFKRKALFLEAPDLATTHAMSTATMVGCLNSLGYDLQRVLPSVVRTTHQSDIRLSLNAFTMLRSGVGADATTLSKVRVVAWVKDIGSYLPLERFRSVLERCGNFVIITHHDLEERLLNHLADFQAQVVSGATFADFVREVGRSAQAADHLLLLGCAGAASELNAYSRYEAGLRSLADCDATLASAVAHLEHSTIAGALASPLTSIRLNTRAADWQDAGVPLTAVLRRLGVSVPISPEKSAWGPFSGIVLAGAGMLSTDWDAVADMMSHMTESTAEELFTALIPFVVQSHGRLLVFALSETMIANAVFANHLQQAMRAAPARHASRRAARVYHNSGDGYIEDESTVVRPGEDGDGRVTFSWQAPCAVESVRFDPVEGAGVICRGVTATVDGGAAEIVPVNCLRFGTTLDVFMTTDPIYDVRGVTPGAKVTVTMDAIDYIDESDFGPPAASEDGPDSYGGPLTPTLVAIQAELAAMRDAHDAMVEIRLRRRVHALIAKSRGWAGRGGA